MGCLNSKPDRRSGAESQPQAPRPIPLQQNPSNQATSSSVPTPRAPQVFPPASSSRNANITNPQAGGQAMSRKIRQAFLKALHDRLREVPYVVIGGSALAEYGSHRRTADVDVLVGGGCSRGSAENLLIQRSGNRFVRLEEGRICYITEDGVYYQLDLSTDTDIDLPFSEDRDTTLMGGVKVATPVFLLNSKARAWQTRAPGGNQQQKRENDARDILFCLQLLKGRQNIDREQLGWVYSNGFWTPFLTAYPAAGKSFREAGLWTDETNFSPGGSSAGGRSSMSSWTHPPTFRSQGST